MHRMLIANGIAGVHYDNPTRPAKYEQCQNIDDNKIMLCLIGGISVACGVLGATLQS